jgi:4-amino-4-deoxy-L-arabinose transferase-like glycosyltransferase
LSKPAARQAAAETLTGGSFSCRLRLSGRGNRVTRRVDRVTRRLGGPPLLSSGMTAPHSTAAEPRAHAASRFSARSLFDRAAWSARLRTPIARIIAFAAVVRVLYWVLVTPNYVPLSDAQQYYQIAQNVAQGRGFAMTFPAIAVHATAFRPPLYPAVLGSFFYVFGTNIVVGRVVNLLIGLIVVGLTYKVGTLIGGARVGLIAAFIVAIYPPIIANDVVLLTEPLSLALILAFVLAISARRVAWAGVIFGLLVLSRPSAQYLVVAAAVWILWRIGWRRALMFVVIVAVVVTPWVIRNDVELGGAVLYTSNGFNLAAIYSPAAKASGGFVDPVYDARFASFRLDQFNEIQWQKDLQTLALNSLRHDPGQVWPVVRRNAQAYFELRPSINKKAEMLDGRNWDFTLWMLPIFYVVTVLGLIGLWLARRDRLVQLLALIMAYFVASGLFLLPPPRLRAPFDLICCLGTAIAVEAWLTRRALSASSASTVPAAG